MTFEQKQQELDQRIRSIQKLEPLECYTQDGIVNVERWQQQEIRPLFVGKERYELGDDEETQAHQELNDTPGEVCWASPRTWYTTAYVSFGLQNDFVSFNQMPRFQDDDRIVDSLRTIAFINVGKYGGDKTTAWERLNDLYNQNRSVLHEQIALYQPNVIIGWSTLEFFKNDEAFADRLVKENQWTNHDAVESWVANGKLYIDAYHPVYRGVNRERYVDSIMAAVKAHFGAIDKSLPTL